MDQRQNRRGTTTTTAPPTASALTRQESVGALTASASMMHPTSGVDGQGGLGTGGAAGNVLEMDKRLLWFESRLSAAFRANYASTTSAGAAGGGSHAIVAAKFAADIRKIFDDDDVRRDVTSFCESDACRMLVAFPCQSLATGGLTIRLTASLADPTMHQAAKIVCFRKLVQTLKSPVVAAVSSPSGNSAAAGPISSGSATAATAAVASGGGGAAAAAGGAASAPTTTGGVPSANLFKITHDNMHRLVSFFECKPHMLSFLTHFVSDVVLPLSQATVAPSSTDSAGTGAVTASGGIGRLSIVSDSGISVPPVAAPAEVLPAWGAFASRPALPAPVRRCIEVELESVAQGALVAGGTAEGRTQLPGISPSLLREELVHAARREGNDDANANPTTAAESAPPRRGVVTFNAAPFEGSNAFLPDGVSSSSITLAEAERLAGQWIHLLRETATNTTPIGQQQKQTMATGSAFRFLPISPYDEVAYWRGRVDDLSFLAAQINGSMFRLVEQVLETHGSLYVENLQTARLAVQDQTREAHVILRWLTPLLPFFDAISLQSPTHYELGALLKENIFDKIFHLFYVLWAQCPSSVYPTCSRLASVIAGLAEFVVVHVTHHLSLDMYFLSDPDETRRRVALVFEVTTNFKNAFFRFKNKAVRVVHPPHVADAKGEWQANTQQLFSHVDCFLERCNDILEVLELREHLDKLGQMNISSVEAEPLRLAVADVSKRFHDALIGFSQHAVDHVSERTSVFDDWMKGGVLSTARETMKKLGQEILSDATDGPFGMHLLRRVHSLMPILQHPYMRAHGFLQQVLSAVWKRWAAEIRQIQSIHVNNEYHSFLVPHVPNATKNLLFALAVFRRLYELNVVAMALVHEPYVDQENEDLQEALMIYNATCQRVGAAFEHAFQKWSSSLGEVIARLNASLLQRHPLSRRFYCSLDHHVSDALRDVAMIVAVMAQPIVRDVFAHLVVPKEAFVILQLKSDLSSRYLHLHATISSYYQFVTSVQPHERGLVEFEISTAEMLCKRAADHLTWEDDGDVIDDFNLHISSAVKAVGDALEAVRGPIRRVDAAFERLREIEAAFLPLKQSRVGDRTMSTDDFIARYVEMIAGGKRKQALAAVVEQQYNVAETLVTSINALKEAHSAPIVDFQNSAVRTYVHYAITRFWGKLNTFATETLDNVAHQLDPAWIAQHGGLPLIDAQLVVAEREWPPPPSAHQPSSSAYQRIASLSLRDRSIMASMLPNTAAPSINTTGGGSDAAGSTIPVLACAPDVNKDIRPIVGRILHDVLDSLKSGITALLQHRGHGSKGRPSSSLQSSGLSHVPPHPLFLPEEPEEAGVPCGGATEGMVTGHPQKRLKNDAPPSIPSGSPTSQRIRYEASDEELDEGGSTTTTEDIAEERVFIVPSGAASESTHSHNHRAPSSPAPPPPSSSSSARLLAARTQSMKVRRAVCAFEGKVFDGSSFPATLAVDPLSELERAISLEMSATISPAATKAECVPLATEGARMLQPIRPVGPLAAGGLSPLLQAVANRDAHMALLLEVMSSMTFSVDSAVLGTTRRLDALLSDAVAHAASLTQPMYAFDLLWSPAVANEFKTLIQFGAAPSHGVPPPAYPTGTGTSLSAGHDPTARRRSGAITVGVSSGGDFAPTTVYGLPVEDLRRELLGTRELTDRISTDIPNVKLVCNGWLHIDVRGYKNNMSCQSSDLQQFLLDYVRDQTIGTIESLEQYIHESGARLDNVGVLLDSSGGSGGSAQCSRHAALRDYFELLRYIKMRFEADKHIFMTLSQGLRLLSSQEHLPKNEIMWLSQRVESLQPEWEALFQRGLSVRTQLASVQDSETAAMRHGAIRMNEKITSHHSHVKAGPLFTPQSLETDDQGNLEYEVVWDLFPSATDVTGGTAEGDDGDNEGTHGIDAFEDSALDSSLSVVMAADQGALAALGGIQIMETNDVYALLDAAMAIANAQGDALDEFKQLQDLFEATTTIKLSLVQEAKQELVLVKAVWDLTIHMNHHVAQWVQTPFVDVDGSTLVEECRRFASAYAAMPSAVRTWPVFLMAEKRVQTFMESLPLIQDLKSPALRQRHWADLSVAALGTGDDATTLDEEGVVVDSAAGQPTTVAVPSIFLQHHQLKKSTSRMHDGVGPSNTLDPTSRSFTLGTLIRLDLHEHAAFVRKLVERAEKELVIERTLARIATFWDSASLQFVAATSNVSSALHVQQSRRLNGGGSAAVVAPPPALVAVGGDRKDASQSSSTTASAPVHVLGPLDELVETLDEHLNLLQGMLHSRWVDVFRRAAQSWQLDLQYVESVLSSWVELQTSLLNLFPIFARSEDLRSTMEEEATAFDIASEMFFLLCQQLYEATSGAAEGVDEVENASAVFLLCTTTITVPQSAVDAMKSVLRPTMSFSLQQQQQSTALTPSSSAVASVVASPTRELRFDQSWSNALMEGDTCGGDKNVALRVLALLEAVQDVVSICERRLGSFLELKRRRFPRFFFLSDADLISILSQEHHPPSVCSHISQIMSAVERVEFDGIVSSATASPRSGSPTSSSGTYGPVEYRIVALHSIEGERLPLPEGGVLCSGRPVELWLDDLLVASQVAVRDVISRANIAYVESPRPEWMFAHISQAVLMVARSHWTAETTAALEQVENGSLSAMGDHASHLRLQLARTIECILMPMTPLERKGLISLITVDVHGRDVVQELLHRKVDSPLAFAWQAQTRVYFFNEVEEARRRREAVLAAARANGGKGRRVSRTVASSGTSPAALSLQGGAVAAATGDATSNRLSPLVAAELLLPPRSPTDFDLAATHAVDRCSIQICDTSFQHGLDYTGNCGCLVTTPLTDRCYITMTQALKLSKGGAPAGPAGTGKTETVKDIAHTLGFPVYVFNCSDQMDVLTVSNIFKGLAMSGAWGCFDEFNRIAAEVLSVLAAQVKVLFDAKRRNAPTFQLLTGGGGAIVRPGEVPSKDAGPKQAPACNTENMDDGVSMPTSLQLPLVHSVGVFITMNPGYKGRTELPENVKALFRPCAMVVPDVLHISEILLCAEGYKESKELAAKFVRLYELNQDVLSPEAHYDWGLRAMRAVLLLAGQLKRQLPNHDERSLLLRALRDANTAKLTTSDLFMFERLLIALFPGVKASNSKDDALETAITETMSDHGFFGGTDRVVLRKIVQLRDLLSVRHSVFVMGGTGTGKSSIIQLAKSSFEAAQERCRTATTILSTVPAEDDDDTSAAVVAESFEAHGQSHPVSPGVAAPTPLHGGQRRPPRIHFECFDPKALSAVELYGSVHPYTREWSDGVLSRAFRDFATNHARYHPQRSLGQWIVLDGSIDADWIESMNSVMDDNKLLTLVNNERIPMTASMRLLFEVCNLDHATPATVSRAGILYLNRGDVGWIPMKDRWLLFQPDRVRTVLDPIFDKGFEKFLQFVIINSGTNIPMNPVAHLRNVCQLLQGVLDREEFADMGTISAPHNYERVFLWVCVWAFGLSLPPSAGSTDFRTIFSTFVRREFHAVLKLPDGIASVFDVDIAMNPHTKEVEWVPWRRLWQVPDYFAATSPKRSPTRSDPTNVNKSEKNASPSSNDEDDDLTYMLEDRSKVTEELSLLLTGSRWRLDAKAIAGLNPFAAYSAHQPLRCRFVPLPESTPQVKLLSILVQSEKHVAVVGEAGTGKTALLRYFTNQVLPLLSLTSKRHGADDGAGADNSSPSSPPPSSPRGGTSFTSQNVGGLFASERVGMHSLSDSAWLQTRVDRLLEKHAGRQFAPVSGKQLTLVIENLNLPAPDAFGSQSAHALLRQFVEYGYWYDRTRLTLRQIKQVQLIATVNPSSGQQDVTERLAHKLFLFTTHQPSVASMQRILQTLVAQTLVLGQSVSAHLLSAVRAGLDGATMLLEQVTRTFHPAVDSFHYHFTIRDLLRLGQGLVTIGQSTPEAFIPSMWVYEAMAVFGDRLVSTPERDQCARLVLGLGRNFFNAAVGLDMLQGDRVQLPIFVPFANIEERPDGSFDPLPSYAKVLSFDVLSSEIKKRMRNVSASASQFVLFDDAMSNVCRLSRILSHPGGHAIVVGVSGSGKRSLVKLAAEICFFRVHLREVVAGGSLLQTTSTSQNPPLSAQAGGTKGNSSSAAMSLLHQQQLAAPEIRQEFGRLIYAAAVKNVRTCIVLTQADLEHWGVRQAVDELLSTSFISDALSADERGDVLSRMGQELRSQGEPKFTDVSVCTEYLKQKLSSNLRVVCCLSPFLKTLKPLLRSCSGFLEAQLLYFLEWPQEALMKVAERIVFDAARGGLMVRRASTAADVQHHTGSPENTVKERSLQRVRSRSRSRSVTTLERPATPLAQQTAADPTSPTNALVASSSPTSDDPPAIGDPLSLAPAQRVDTEVFAENVCAYLASSHQLARETAAYISKTEHQDVYVTPKTFLTFCQQALSQIKCRRNTLETRHTRLRVGLDRLHACRDRVGVLQLELGDYKRAVQQQATVANQLFSRVRAERNVVEDQNRIARAEHQRTQKIVDEVNALVAECEADILAAQPIVDAARAALNTLNRPNLTELKTMNNPPEAVHAVTGCVMCIIANQGRVPLDRSWSASRRMMADVPRWMKTLEELDVNNLPDPNIHAIEQTVKQPWFNPVDIVRVSFAASSLCAWVVSVVKYHHIRVMLRPKEARLAEAQQRLASSQGQAKRVQDRCDALQSKLDALVVQCNDAEAERDRLDYLLTSTEAKLQRAQRLLAALADEKDRWAEGLSSVAEDREYVDGDSLLGAAFATYCGPLPATSRERMIAQCARDLNTIGSPCTPDSTSDVIKILFGASEAVVWRNEGLAAAGYMAQNAAITLTSSVRWPMVIDPQHQAIRWLRGRALSRSQEFTVLSPTDPDLPLKAVTCVSKGHLTVVELQAPYDIPPLLLAMVEKRYQQKVQMRRSTSMVGSSALAQRRRSLSPATSPPEQALTASPPQPEEGRRGEGGEEEEAPPTLVPLTSSLSMRNLLRTTSSGGLAASTGGGGGAHRIVHTVDIGPDHEAVVHEDFFLVIRCAVARPVLRPDIFSQCSIVDFRVTEAALTEEMLSIVVSAEQPALEKQRLELTDRMNRMTVSLRDCESLLLNELATATGDVLDNEILIQTLEHAKKQSVDLTASLIVAEEQRIVLQRVLSIYEPIALRGCLMYMATNHFHHVDPVYHYSMDLMIAQFQRTVLRTTAELNARQAAYLERAAAMASPVSAGGAAASSSIKGPQMTARPALGKAATAPLSSVGGGGGAAPPSMEVTEDDRIAALLGNVTNSLFRFVDQSLFADHKLVYAMTVALSVLQRTGAIEPQHALYFLRGSKRLFGEPPKHVADWLSKAQWEHINRLADLDGVVPSFRNLVDECVETTRWRSWCELPRPETERLPGDWKALTPFQRVLLVRALRPDRLIPACAIFLQDSFLSKALISAATAAGTTDQHHSGPPRAKTTNVSTATAGGGTAAGASSSNSGGGGSDNSANPLLDIVDQMPNKNPILFLLTPGFDPEGQVQSAAAACGMSSRVVVLSMGQSQERRARDAMERARTKGVWVLLHNIHLMRGWLPDLDAFIQSLAVLTVTPSPSGAPAVPSTAPLASQPLHPKFRLFLSSEPVEHLPSGLLQNSIKLVQEPPSGLRHNFLRAYQSFAETTPWEHSTKPHEYHMTVYSLCFFHAVVVERAKFGPVGWNAKYPFNAEDLRVCVDVLTTYIEDRPRIPWEDLRYMFGEIMYGGHITERWDRRLSMTYLAQFISPDILERAELSPGVPFPRTRNHSETKQFISEFFPEESPVLYQLNPVSENRVRLRDGRSLVASLVNTVQASRQPLVPGGPVVGSPKSNTASGGGGPGFDAADDDERIDDISLLLGALPDTIPLDEVAERLGEDRPPFHHVFFQECERMNKLVVVMQKTLEAAEAAVRGTQAMSSEIDDFLLDVSCDRIPQRWRSLWGHTKRPLASWLQLVGDASRQLNRWAMELMVPKIVNLSCLFIPIAFIGAVLQDASLRVGEALDHMSLVVEVTKRAPHQIELHAREGIYVHGPSLEGASWDPLTQCLQDATLRDGQPMPVLILRAAPASKVDRADTYACPMYRTTDRGQTFVAALHLRTKLPASTWTLRGTALIMDAAF